MKNPKHYNLTPAKGQALLNYQGRLYPDKVELFETKLIEEVRQQKKSDSFKQSKETDLNPDFRNLLIHGDCLSACAYLKSKDIKVDLVYIDPPFASGANYAKQIYLRNGGKSGLDNNDNSIGEEIMYGDIWQKEDYLNWLYERLLAIKDVMSETGSIYVHLDWHIGHYVKLLLDEIFGEENLKNEIIWYYTNKIPDTRKRLFTNATDIILFYSKSESNVFNPLYDKRDIPIKVSKMEKVNGKKIYVRSENGKVEMITRNERVVDNVWKISLLHAQQERTDYATQKPEELIQRIIKSSSNEGMIIADFFVGSGTTAKAANDLGRKFIACDIGINAIQTSRDRLKEAVAEFDILKVNDGVRLFRNPAQTTARIFSLIDGYKNRTELELGEFWDGGIINTRGSYTPVKFIGIHEKLTKHLADIILEEIYQLESDSENAVGVKLIYAHKDLEIDQNYINKEIRKSGKTTLKVELISLDGLLDKKADVLFTPDNADISVKKQGDKYEVKIKRFASSYLKTKIDEYNAKKVKKDLQDEADEKKEPKKFAPIKISNDGLELIEAVQFDTTLREDGVWASNPELEDKAGIKEKIKGVYHLNTDKFRIKIRNIAGDEIIIDSKELK